MDWLWPPSRVRRGALILLLVLVGGLIVGVVALRQNAATEQGPPTVGWRGPDPNRPVLEVSYAVAPDLRSATGEERLTFRPDRRICELVWRAWPNKPDTARTGNSLTVTEVRLNSAPVPFDVQAAGAPRGQPGTLIEVTLPQCAAAGDVVLAELDFTLTFGVGTDERIGVSRTGQLAWFGTAFPLLAWERDRGWAREDAVGVVGEMATSEAFRLESLRVSAPSAFAVAGVGHLVGTTPDPAGGRTTHEYAAEALRDISVTVGALDSLVRQVGHVAVHVVAPSDSDGPPVRVWAEEAEGAIRRLEAYLGPFPYPDLWVSHLPDQTDGIEFPSAVQLGRLALPAQRDIITHELAHQYFYALVGNNQARSPWLDESVTTLVQRVVDDPSRNPPLNERYSGWFATHWGLSMAEWQTVDSPTPQYITGVYLAGPDALLKARRSAGSDVFDRALRRYLQDNAQAIATPADFARAFAGVPEVTRALETGQAFEGAAVRQ